jgi:hypothetical protein
MPKLTDTQLMLLSKATHHDGLLVIPANLKGAAATKAVNPLLAHGLIKVPGFRMTASLGIRLGDTNSDPRPRRKRSNEFRFGARRRARLLMSNWCFSNKDSATTARTPPGQTSFAMVANRWTARMSR